MCSCTASNNGLLVPTFSTETRYIIPVMTCSRMACATKINNTQRRKCYPSEPELICCYLTGSDRNATDKRSFTVEPEAKIDSEEETLCTVLTGKLHPLFRAVIPLHAKRTIFFNSHPLDRGLFFASFSIRSKLTK